MPTKKFLPLAALYTLQGNVIGLKLCRFWLNRLKLQVSNSYKQYSVQTPRKKARKLWSGKASGCPLYVSTAISKDFFACAAISSTPSNSSSEGLPYTLFQIVLVVRLYFAKIYSGKRNRLFLKEQGTRLKYSHIPIQHQQKRYGLAQMVDYFLYVLVGDIDPEQFQQKSQLGSFAVVCHFPHFRHGRQRPVANLMGSDSDHPREVAVGEGIVCYGMIETDRQGFGLRFLLVIDLVKSIFPEVQLAQSFVNAEIPKGASLAFQEILVSYKSKRCIAQQGAFRGPGKQLANMYCTQLLFLSVYSTYF